MNGRELVILLLGLAIVAVVLRGLYVAINARRGQIKLAIDKNIPQDVDLESLELAELPGGGARVVTRSLEEVNRQNNALDLAEIKSKSLNLTDAEGDSHIPVLMDAVELSEPAEDFAVETSPADEPVAEDSEEFEQEEAEELIEEEAEEEIEEDFIPQAKQEHSFGEDWEEGEVESNIEESHPEQQAEIESEAENADDTDAALFDYEGEESVEADVPDSADAMSSIAPDYADDSEEAYESSSEISDDESYEDDEVNEEAEFLEQEITAEEQAEEQPVPFDADNSVDEFSMTAGERIGGNPPTIDENNQSGLFDDDEEEEETVNPKTSRSLFSFFGRKSKQKALDDEGQPSPAVAEIEESAIDEHDDVLFEESPAQLNVGGSEYLEPVSEQSGYDEAVSDETAFEDGAIDELGQMRSASLENEVEEPEHSEVLVLNVTAKEGRVFSGDDLLQVLITEGLKFGDMSIFHKRLSKEHQGTVIFSVANMLNPGTFDLNNMDEFTTLGISFFLALPTAINNLDAFEQMLAVAQEIRDTLDGDLKDDHRNGMTGQTIEHYRQRIRDFELRRLKAVAARG
tara:strand:+ start:5904 stop:7622 length:1719 start_codon:yes stop_codon:yes gene_type:complete